MNSMDTATYLGCSLEEVNKAYYYISYPDYLKYRNRQRRMHSKHSDGVTQL